MELCYRGIRYEIAQSIQFAQRQVAIMLPIVLIYRGNQYKLNLQSVENYQSTATYWEQSIIQKAVTSKWQLTYRGVAYAIPQ